MLPYSCVLSGCFLLSLHKDGPCDFKTQTYYAPHSNEKLLEPQSCTRMTVVFRFTSARTEREQVLSYYPFLYHSQTVALLIGHARLSPLPSFCPHPYSLSVVFRAMHMLRGYSKPGCQCAPGLE